LKLVISIFLNVLERKYIGTLLKDKVHKLYWLNKSSKRLHCMFIDNVFLCLLWYHCLYVVLVLEERVLLMCKVLRLIEYSILGYPGVISLATSTPGTISWISFDVPLRHHPHFRMSKMTNENDPYKRAVIWLHRTL